MGIWLAAMGGLGVSRVLSGLAATVEAGHRGRPLVTHLRYPDAVKDKDEDAL